MVPVIAILVWWKVRYAILHMKTIINGLWNGNKRFQKDALKQGSLIESKKTMEKKEKKSIHERLKINKEIIAKKQGKDSKEKGVELA